MPGGNAKGLISFACLKKWSAVIEWSLCIKMSNKLVFAVIFLSLKKTLKDNETPDFLDGILYVVCSSLVNFL